MPEIPPGSLLDDRASRGRWCASGETFMARDDGYDDRPRPSWSEIDKRREKARSRTSGSPASSRVEKTATYSRYKSAADAFFSGGLVPEALADKLDPDGSGQQRRQALARLKAAESATAFAGEARSYLSAHGLPDDPYLLERLLDHPDAALALRAIEQIGALVEAGTFKAPKSLPQRLKSLELGSDDPELQDAAKALAARLRSAGRP